MSFFTRQGGTLRAISRKPLGIELYDFTFDLMTYKGNLCANIKKIHEIDFQNVLILVIFTKIGS